MNGACRPTCWIHAYIHNTVTTGETDAAADAFRKALVGYCQGPFGTWTERSPSEQGGAAGGIANFLPAGGGFVQAVLHSYAGLRLLERSDAAGGGNDGGEAAARLRLLPRCPPGVRGVRLRRVAFLGSQLALNYTTASMTVSLARCPPSGPRLALVLPDDGKDWGSARRVPLVPGSAVTVPVQEAFIVGILEKEKEEEGGVSVTIGAGSHSAVGVVAAASAAAAGGGKDCTHVC